MTPVALVEATRGAFAESVHYGSIAVVDASGRLLFAVGDPHRATTMRSAAKPFQAMEVLECGAADAFDMEPHELAIIAGSHSGEPRHVHTVAGLLARAGLSPDELQNGTQPPMHGPSRSALERVGEKPSALHQNCSGKHCGMLCACTHQGWDRRTYVRPDHPLQRRIRELVADMTGQAIEAIGVAIDGCGVPTFVAPLFGIATAFARLAAPDVLPPQRAEAAARVRDAMLRHPEMVGGEGRLDTDLMSQAAGRIVAKSGAEGCYGAALLDRGLGLALKIEDGSSRAVPVAVVAALRQLDVLTDADVDCLTGHARPLVRNYREEVVGELRPTFHLLALS